MKLVREVLFKGATIHGVGARTWNQAHAGDRLLATAHSVPTNGKWLARLLFGNLSRDRRFGAE